MIYLSYMSEFELYKMIYAPLANVFKTCFGISLSILFIVYYFGSHEHSEDTYKLYL